MRRVLLALFLLIPTVAFSQGTILPDFPQQFFANDGSPLSSGFVCLTISGTTTNLASYPTAADAIAGTNANANPVQLDSSGRASIFMGSGTYRAVLLNATGQGNSTCNGRSTGSAIKTVDGLSQFGGALTVAIINGIRYCNAFAGTTGGDKITACLASLPSTGGTADASGILGIQSIANTIVISKPAKLILGAATYISTITAGMVNIFTLASAGASIECLNPGATAIVAATDTNGIGITAGPAAVRNCTLTGPALPMSVLQGVNSSAVQNVEITGNLVEKWGNGINTGTGHVPGNYWKIHGNTVRLNEADGIFIPSDNNEISGNIIYSNQSNGIDVNGSWNAIVDNVLYANGLGHTGSTDAYGILLAAVTSVDSNYNTVTGNTVSTSAGQGIIVKPTTSQNTNFNTITGNVVSGGTGTGADGISLDGSSAGTIKGNVVTGNTTVNNARHGIVVDGAVSTVTGNTVSVNFSSSNLGYGLLVTSAATTTIIANNISLSNTMGNLSDNGVGTVKSGNVISGTKGFWVDSGAATTPGTDGIFFGDRTNGWLLTEAMDASSCLRLTASGVPTGTARFCVASNGDTTIGAGSLTINNGVTISSASTPLIHHFSGSTSLTFNSSANFAANTCYDAGGLTATNAAVGDTVSLGIPATIMNAGLSVTGWVSGTNTVSVRICNPTTGTVTNAGAATFTVDVWHH